MSEKGQQLRPNFICDGEQTDARLEFLRLEHSFMLNGLQNEIEKLQTKCNDLQFQLVFNGIRPTLGNEEEDDLKEKVERLELELTEKNRTCEELRTELREKSETVERLEEEAKQREERYQEDVSARNLIVAKLRKEVQEKANTISNLVKLLRMRPPTSLSMENGSNLNREEILRKAEAEAHPYRTIGSASTRVALTVFSPQQQQQSRDEGTSSSKRSSTSGSYLDLGKKLVEKYCNSRPSCGTSVNGNVASSSFQRPLQMPSKPESGATATCNRRKRPDTLSIGTTTANGHFHQHHRHLHRMQSSRASRQTGNEAEPKTQLHSIVSPSL